MTTQDQVSNGESGEYLSKKVIVNGQFVTLYSSNGHTWLSSPEELPEVMARLENIRISMTDLKGQVVGPGAKGEAKGAEATGSDVKGEGEKPPVASAPSEPVISNPSKYRMKGPKPRPILRQGGVAVKGISVEPFSASTVQVKVEAQNPTQKATPKLKSPVKSAAKVLAKVSGMVVAKVAAPLPQGKKIKIVAIEGGKAAPLKVIKGAKAVQVKKPSAVATTAKAKVAPAIRAGKSIEKKPTQIKKGVVFISKAKPTKATKASKKQKTISKRRSK